MSSLSYAERRAAGQCGRCGVVDPGPYCDACRAKRAAYKARTRDRRAKMGKCLACGRRKPLEEHVHCRSCQERLNAASRASHARRRRAKD
jgi:hypothetical protein